MSVAQGNKVVAANINNDRGIHIIKSMYGYLVYGKKQEEPGERDYKKALQLWNDHPELWHTPESLQLKPDHLVGKYYVLGNNDYEDSEKQLEEGAVPDPSAPHNQMQQMLVEWEDAEPLIRKLWQQNNDWFYQGRNQTLKAYGIKSPNDPSKFFDKEWYESQVYKQAKDIITSHLGNGVIKECEDGHVEAILEKYGLPNVVLLRKNKTSLYITQDIELMRQRIKEDHNDTVTILTDSAQNLRFQQLYAICEALEIVPLSHMVHIGYGMVRLPEGRMSSRKGTVIVADELLQQVSDKALEKINHERAEYSESEKQQISSQVAIAAIKYGILKYNPMSNIIFDIEKSLAFEGETGPYLQYTHARATSIIRKYQDKFGTVATESDKSGVLELSSEEKSLVRHLQKFSDWIEKSQSSYSPNYLCEYLFTLAQKFNLFYAHCQILNEEDPALRQQRLRITLKSQEILKTGLNLLGIEAPNKM
jgi:arginyl-tRNA synthetase